MKIVLKVIAHDVSPVAMFSPPFLLVGEFEREGQLVTGSDFLPPKGGALYPAANHSLGQWTLALD